MSTVNKPVAASIKTPVKNADTDELAELREANRRLEIMNKVLIRHAEQEVSVNAESPFSYFYLTVMMEKMLLERSRELYETNMKLTRMNHQLSQSRQELTQEIQRRMVFEKQLNLAKEQAEVANRNKTRFLASASHDLMQPLNSARLFLYSLKQLDLTQGAPELIGSMEKSLGLVSTMIQALLDISKIDCGVTVPSISTFSLQSVFEDLHNEFHLRAVQKNIRLHIVPTGAIINSDPVYLYRILQNLISNALRYAPQGRIAVGAKRQGNNLFIRVIDNGIGISQKNCRRIFDEFYRCSPEVGSAPEMSHETGMGLGLSIAKRLADQLKLKLSVRSKPRFGTAFTIYIPHQMINQTGGTLLKKPTGVSRITERHQGRVLFLEDDPTGKQQLEDLLTLWSFAVFSRPTAVGICPCLKKAGFIPDIIIADFHLCGRTNGLKAIQRVQKFVGRLIPAVLISADLPQSAYSDVEAMSVRFLPKPLDPNRLKETLGNLMQGQQNRFSPGT